MPLAELKNAFCKSPFGLTEAMVVLYVCALVKTGGFELVLNTSTPIMLANEKPLPGNRLTTHALALCEWNAKLDKALLGARLIVSVQKGWNEVLPYARVLDDTLKPVATPDEEPQRNEQLLTILGKLKAELPEVNKSLTTLASKLGGIVPKSLTETCARLTGLAASASFQEFDAAVRESYPSRDDFVKAFEQYAKGRQLRDRAFDLSQARDYLSGACDIDVLVDLQRDSVLCFFGFDTLLKDPEIIPVRMESFEKWKKSYVHAYRKAHRAYYQKLTEFENGLGTLNPKARALVKMNTIVELGPPLSTMSSIATDLAAIEKRLYVCPDADEASIDGAEPKCPKCSWTPAVQPPTAEVEKLTALVASGLADRFQRFKDATIGAILKKAAENGGRPDLTKLLEIVQLANADGLTGVLTDDLVDFLRKLLYDENLVQEEIPLGPIVSDVGAIEEDHIDEAVDKFAKLLTKAVKDAKAKHGKSKRVRIFLRLQAPNGSVQ